MPAVLLVCGQFASLNVILELSPGLSVGKPEYKSIGQQLMIRSWELGIYLSFAWC